MVRRIGIGLVLLLFAFSAKAQEDTLNPEKAGNYFYWTLIVRNEGEMETRGGRLLFDTPVSIFQGKKLIANAQVGTSREFQFWANNAELRRGFVELRGRCWIHYGVRARYFSYKSKRIPLTSQRGTVSIDLISNDI